MNCFERDQNPPLAVNKQEIHCLERLHKSHGIMAERARRDVDEDTKLETHLQRVPNRVLQSRNPDRKFREIP